MAVIVFTVGEVLTSADTNAWFLPRVVRKLTDQQSGNAALADDGALYASLDANAEYEFGLRLVVTGATITNGDIKVTLAWPAGASGQWWGSGAGVVATVPYTAAVMHVETTSGDTHVHSFGVDGATPLPVWIWGDIVTSATSGLLKLRWCQDTANGATPTVVKAGSKLVLRRTG